MSALDEKEASRAKARGWLHFPHDADVGIEGWGPTLEAAFEETALALTATVTSATITPTTTVDVTCEGPDRELLFVEWLNTIIYEMAVRRMLFGQFHVHLVGNTLQGKLWGETVDPTRHEPACEPKGATYTALSVLQNDKGVWSARCVVDV